MRFVDEFGTVGFMIFAVEGLGFSDDVDIAVRQSALVIMRHFSVNLLEGRLIYLKQA